MKKCVLFAICGLTFMLAACDDGGLKGRYIGTVPGNVGRSSASIDFRSDGKVFATQGSNEVAGTFEVDGDKVNVVINGRSTVFTRAPDGTLTGQGVTFTKE